MPQKIAYFTEEAPRFIRKHKFAKSPVLWGVSHFELSSRFLLLPTVVLFMQAHQHSFVIRFLDLYEKLNLPME